MRILSMTATFGKLSRQTLTLEPGMNIVEAPNEWGKSTWCAFVMAMLYGIDTGERTKTGFLAEKQHYAPWSGEPMSGRMDLLWNGREITIERQLKGRTPLGEVKAYETQTGLAVQELCISAPGQVLLGVERSVFARAGFLKQSEMPVTDDEALRRRLNELVTTGDESGASDALSKKLNDLKNACRANSRKGLIPEQEAQLLVVEQRLRQLQLLKEQTEEARQRQQALAEQLKALENHKQALEYAQQLDYVRKMELAEADSAAAANKLAAAEQACAELPPLAELEQNLLAVQQLRDTREALHTKVHLLPTLPPAPNVPDVFRGRDTDRVVQEAQQDRQNLENLAKRKKNPLFLALGGAGLVAGLAVLILIGQPLGLIGGGVLILAGMGAAAAGLVQKKKLQAQKAEILERYRGISADCWETAAAEYVQAQQRYQQLVDDREQAHAAIARELDKNSEEIARVTGGVSLAVYEETCRKHQQKYQRLTEIQRDAQQAAAVLQALKDGCKDVQPPAFEDNLTWSVQETARLLSEKTVEQQLMHQKVGQLEGQMEALGKAEILEQEKTRIQARLQALELYRTALVRAQETLAMATQELQRRFAPRISQRAQELFGRLTGQRYKRLMLTQDLSVETGAEGEINLHNSLWRSDGTVDQLYLALRMAVAEELTPDAPLILDDALVRFDDVRMAEALKILREESEKKQVILFTCQSREKALEETL